MEPDAIPTGQVTVKSGYAIGKILKSTLKSLLAIVIVVFVVYAAALTPTSVRYLWSSDGAATVLTKDPAERNGDIPVGTKVVLSPDDEGKTLSGPWTKFVAAFTLHSGLVEAKVMTPSTGKLDVNVKGKLTVDGKVTKVRASRLPKDMWPEHSLMVDTYVLQCVGGSCRKNAVFYAPKTDVIGQLVSNKGPDMPTIDFQSYKETVDGLLNGESGDDDGNASDSGGEKASGSHNNKRDKSIISKSEKRANK